jgi:hypothetical protein
LNFTRIFSQRQNPADSAIDIGGSDIQLLLLAPISQQPVETPASPFAIRDRPQSKGAWFVK